MRNFGAPTYNGPIESIQSMLPEWLTWKTALAIYGVRAVAGYIIFQQASKKFEAAGSSKRAAKVKATGTAGVLSTVVTIPIAYYIATRAEEQKALV